MATTNSYQVLLYICMGLKKGILWGVGWPAQLHGGLSDTCMAGEKLSLDANCAGERPRAGAARRPARAASPPTMVSRRQPAHIGEPL